jgi:nucleoside-diphosphate-sugar epimerase
VANVLVTGATGLIGGPITKRLVEMGHNVLAFDVAPNRTNLGEVADDVDVVQGDVADLAAVQNVMKGRHIDRVVHMAALLGAQGAGATTRQSVIVNCVGTANVFDAALEHGVERVCWASSAGVYGRRSQYKKGRLLNEEDLLGPFSVYRSTKVLCEQVSLSYRQMGLDVIGIRPVISYGIGRLAGGGTSAINEAIRDMAVGRPAVFPAMLGGLEDTWQPMYNKDVAETFVAGTFVGRTEHAIFNPPANEIITLEEN